MDFLVVNITHVPNRWTDLPSDEELAEIASSSGHREIKERKGVPNECLNFSTQYKIDHKYKLGFAERTNDPKIKRFDVIFFHSKRQIVGLYENAEIIERRKDNINGHDIHSNIRCDADKWTLFDKPIDLVPEKHLSQKDAVKLRVGQIGFVYIDKIASTNILDDVIAVTTNKDEKAYLLKIATKITKHKTERPESGMSWWRIGTWRVDEWYTNKYYNAGHYDSVDYSDLIRCNLLESYQDVDHFIQSTFFGKPHNFQNDWRYTLKSVAFDMQKGDIFVIFDWPNNSIVMVGKMGEYYYNDKIGHMRNVEWVKLDPPLIIEDEKVINEIRYWKTKAIHNLDTIADDLEKIVAKIGISISNLPNSEKIVNLDQTDDLIFKNFNVFRDMFSGLDRKKQIVLFGPPGTGKTYYAKKFAIWYLLRYMGKSKYGSDLLLQDQSLKNAEIELFDNKVLTSITFHPSYTYEDFIEGYKPVPSGDGKLNLKLTNGIFKQICIEAAKRENQNKRFVILIDEINRANIAKVLGELITLLEKDKRNTNIILSQSQEDFLIPDNVYLIGTMNTADTSIKVFDLALRRRFSFVEMMPDPEILENMTIDGLNLSLFLVELNSRIVEHLSREKQIGHAYFMDGSNVISNIDEFLDRFKQDILPLLEEYCYRDYTLLSKFFGNKIIDVERQKINYNLVTQPSLLVSELINEYDIGN